MRKIPGILLFIILMAVHTVSAQPFVSGFSPASGAAGSTVTISGANFSSTASSNIVFFGGVRANVTAASSNSLNVQVPVSSGFNQISVTVAGLTSISRQFFTTTFSGGGVLTSESFFYAGRADSLLNIETNDIAIGDIDGDGKQDFAVVDRIDDSLSIYRNTGTLTTVSFADKVDYLTGLDPQDMVMADLDGDGKPDIAVSNRSAHTVSVFRNTSTPGNISFANKIDFASANNPGSLVASDLNGDGLQDLSIGCFGSFGTLSILKNTSTIGSISFAAHQDFTSSGVLNDMKTADMDGDGKADIVFCDFINQCVSVSRNTSTIGTISFAPRVNFPTGPFPTSTALADLDGNGQLDVAITDIDQNYVSVFRNTSSSGSISMSSRQDYQANNGPNAVSFGDVNGDSKPDMVVLDDDPANSARAISVFINTSSLGTVSFAAKFDYSAVGYDDIQVAEVTGDGKSDIVVVGSLFRALVFKNRVGEPIITSFTPTIAGPGTTVTITGANFTGATSVQFGGIAATSFTVVNPTTITAVVGAGATGDVSVTNVSGTAYAPGFVFTSVPVIAGFSPAIGGTGSVITISGANFTGATGVSFGGTPATSFTVVSPSTITAVVGSGASGDVTVQLPSGPVSLSGFTYTTGIVITSFAPLSGTAGSTVTITGANFSTTASNNLVYFGQHKAVVTAATPSSLTVTVPASASYKPITVTVNNLTAYSRLPFIMTFSGGGSFVTNSLSPRLDFSIGSPSYNGTLCDWDGDGKLDVAATGFDHARVALFRNTSSSGSISFGPRIDSTTGNNPRDVSGDDMDGDGRKELLVTGFQNNVFQNNGTPGTISFQPKTNVPTSGIPQDFFTADINNDGKPDFAVANNLNISVIRNTTSAGVLSFAAEQNFAVGSLPQAVCLGDLNDDGRVDMIAVNASSNTVTILKNTSSTSTISFGSNQDFTTGAKPWHVATGDVDGDGKLDVIVVNFDANTFSVFRNTSSGGNITLAAKQDFGTGGEPRHVALADMTGDGKVDVVTVNVTSNTVSIFRNTSVSGAISFAGRSDYATSSFPQSVTLDDIDGDGKPDILVSSYSPGNASVHRNKVNEPSTTITSFSPATAGPGATVTITGNYFTGATAVSFGGTPAASFTVVNPTTIIAVIATGSSGNVVVSSPMGVASATGFVYSVPAPTITSFSPSSGGPGTVVTVTGTNFYNPLNVAFGGTFAAPVTVNSLTNLSATVNIGSTGLVSVMTQGGTATSSTPFTFFPQPQLFSFSPSSGGPGTVITITGNNLSGVNAVQFGGVSASSFSIVSNTTITAIVGAGASGNVTLNSPGGSVSLAGFTFNPVTAVGNPAANSKELIVSPNPADVDCNVLVKYPVSTKQAQLKLIDITGKEVMIVALPPNTKQQTIHVSTLSTGIYKLLWTDGVRVLRRNLMVQ